MSITRRNPNEDQRAAGSSPETGSAIHGATYHELDEANAKLCAENAALTEVMHWAQAVLTALNVGDIKSGSPLHLKLREVMVTYRTSKEESPNADFREPAK